MSGANSKIGELSALFGSIEDEQGTSDEVSSAEPALDWHSFVCMLGTYFYFRRLNKLAELEAILVDLKTLSEYEDNAEAREALVVINDFRSYEAAAKGWPSHTH